MTDETFWNSVARCRDRSTDMASFCAVLQQTLAELPSDDLWSFYQTVWLLAEQLQFKGGFNEFNDELNATLEEGMGLQIGGDTGDCYAGWVIAQGEDFYKGILNHPRKAAERLPSWDDVWEGENVVFLAARVFTERTGKSLQDVYLKTN